MADPNVDLWAIDEVHFQQHGSRCQMWIPPETKDPVLLHHPTRRSVGYLVRFGFATASSFFSARRTSSTGPPSLFFSKPSIASALLGYEGWWSSRTMLAITM